MKIKEVKTYEIEQKFFYLDELNELLEELKVILKPKEKRGRPKTANTKICPKCKLKTIPIYRKYCDICTSSINGKAIG